MKHPIFVKSLCKTIVIVIFITNNCNFKCSYCVAGGRGGKTFLDSNKLKDIINFIKYIKKEKSNHKIKIIISGGEPTLHKDFFYLIEKLLCIKSLIISVSTNGYILPKKQEKLYKIGKINNKINLSFKITYHFNNYLNKKSTLEDIIKVLKKYKINFVINFLIPDKYDFKLYLSFIKKLITNTLLKNNNYYYSLIRDLEGNISRFYDSEAKRFYKNYNSLIQKIPDTLISYNNKSIKIHSDNIWEEGINKYKGWECHYISDDYISLYISEKGKINFGCCYNLNKMNLSINKAKKLIKNGSKTILCGSNICKYENDILITKNISRNYNKILKLEQILINKFKDKISPLNLKSVTISLGISITFFIKYNDLFFYFYIEKKEKENNYFYIKDNIGIHFAIKDINNIFYVEDNLDSNTKIIIGKIKRLFVSYILLFKNIV